MNRRQMKKAYKKRYGHNPTEDVLTEGIVNLLDAAKKAIEVLGEQLEKDSKQVKERIQTMTEEEYAEYLEILTPKQRGLAATIRMAAK